MARILVIEDHPTNLELMSYLLRAWGHEVDTAVDGLQGLERAGVQPPDLVVCDIGLPGMDGYEVARRLKAGPATARVPLVAVTAYAMVGDQEKALRAGFDAHVPKPIEPVALMAALAPFLSAPGSVPSPAPATATDEPPAPARMPVHLCAPRPGLTVLLVDDTAANLDFKLGLLEPAGYAVHTAAGGHEALALLQRERVDLVVSDVVMARGGGFDLLAAVRASPVMHTVPFVFLTATARDEASRERGLALGADDYLLRPIEPEALLAALRAHLGG